MGKQVYRSRTKTASQAATASWWSCLGETGWEQEVMTSYKFHDRTKNNKWRYIRVNLLRLGKLDFFFLGLAASYQRKQINKFVLPWHDCKSSNSRKRKFKRITFVFLCPQINEICLLFLKIKGVSLLINE